MYTLHHGVQRSQSTRSGHLHIVSQGERARTLPLQNLVRRSRAVSTCPLSTHPSRPNDFIAMCHNPKISCFLHSSAIFVKLDINSCCFSGRLKSGYVRLGNTLNICVAFITEWTEFGSSFLMGICSASIMASKKGAQCESAILRDLLDTSMLKTSGRVVKNCRRLISVTSHTANTALRPFSLSRAVVTYLVSSLSQRHIANIDCVLHDVSDIHSMYILKTPCLWSSERTIADLMGSEHSIFRST
mmetsp:Transcript_2147/g.3018  ORF Transcript_2147/g.3018 Transcript_2147/m.3018 type:complete len:244 (+) Transcript_2147:24-755(+)